MKNRMQLYICLRVIALKLRRDELTRYKITLYGIVQGVGFRPYVYSKAAKLGVKGYVKNIGSALFIDAEAPKYIIKELLITLLYSPPPLAQIETVSIRKQEIKHWQSFDILESDRADEQLSFIPRDIATCERCRQDIFDENGRWFGYAFTNCTDCGARYSIIKELPYDRCNTTMGSFKMCFSCSEDYNDSSSSSRRFHAQPVCCADCGPRLQLADKSGKPIQYTDIIKSSVKLLKQGKILAVKGVGGFHLMCDGENEHAIAALRSRKGRPHKPLALLVKNLEVIRNWCVVNEAEAELLQSPERPIVLLEKKNHWDLSALIAPDTNKIGIMLPYTPLHYLLFKEDINCLIATSGNISGSPIEYDNAEAVSKLCHVADYFLLNNRDINVPIDDSVAKVFRGHKLVSRAGRGYTPLSFNLGIKHQLAALGAEQKASVSISKGGYIFLSQYLGDLKSPQAYEAYKKVLDNLLRLTKVKPAVYIHDLHPDYLSTKYAMEQKEDKLAILHHFAHMASCIAEHKLKKPVIGVIYDGTGLGDDGKIWGGEFLVGELKGCKRAGHLSYVRLQGGDAAIKEPWRTAISYIYNSGLSEGHMLRGIDSFEKELITSALRSNFNCYETSSMGRLFDCIAALLGLCYRITYEAQGAIMLEKAADPCAKGCYSYSIYKEGACLELNYQELIIEVLKEIREGKSKAEIAGKFHNTVAAATAELVIAISKLYGIKDVVLSGGCFENSLLLGRVLDKLENKGYNVYFNKLVPCNDGGISFGQLAAADSILRG